LHKKEGVWYQRVSQDRAGAVINNQDSLSAIKYAQQKSSKQERNLPLIDDNSSNDLAQCAKWFVAVVAESKTLIPLALVLVMFTLTTRFKCDTIRDLCTTQVLCINYPTLSTIALLQHPTRDFF
jgi:hypothetical protein